MGRDEVRDSLGRFRAGPGRVNEGVRAVVFRGGDHLERALHVGVGLARKADDQVGGNGEIGDCGAGVCQLLQIALRGVATVHRGQDTVAAGLHG